MTGGINGVLHLVPVTLNGDNVRAALPAATLDIVAGLDYFIVENEKSARRFLKLVPHPQPLLQLQLERFDKSSDGAHALELLQPIVKGRNAAVLSEAGCPVIADPG